MLAQNFKTAADLGISEKGHDALRGVLGMLEREDIPERLFKMRSVGKPECGTAGCILGWTRTFGLETFGDLVSVACGVGQEADASLWALFYTWEAFDATPAQGAIALRSYLTTGDANWAEALA